jgi:hypothetical protein
MDRTIQALLRSLAHADRREPRPHHALPDGLGPSTKGVQMLLDYVQMLLD